MYACNVMQCNVLLGPNDYMPKNCFEQLIFELHRITVHSFCLPGLISGCNVMVSLSRARKRGTTRESVYITLPHGGLPANSSISPIALHAFLNLTGI